MMTEEMSEREQTPRDKQLDNEAALNPEPEIYDLPGEDLDLTQPVENALAEPAETTEGIQEPEAVSTGVLTEPEAKKPPIRTRKGGGLWVLGGFIFLILALGLGVWTGYSRGVARRLSAQKDSVLTVAEQQLSLVYEDMNKGEYEPAQQRVEYILQIYPDFPGAADLLNEIKAKQQIVDQPTPTAVVIVQPTQEGPTPTPDLRGAEDLLNAAKQAVAEQKWSAALESINQLRENFYSYNTAQVNGLYYVSLRNDGINLIYNGKLEQGIWELNEASQLGALDNQAAGAINLANLYVTGASYWDNNWPEVIRIFGELKDAYPNLADATGMTTTERYRVALYKQGMAHAAGGDFCSAVPWYQRSLQQAADSYISALLTQAETECNRPDPTPIPADPTPVDPAQPPAPTEVPAEPPAEPTPEPATP